MRLVYVLVIIVVLTTIVRCDGMETATATSCLDLVNKDSSDTDIVCCIHTLAEYGNVADISSVGIFSSTITINADHGDYDIILLSALKVIRRTRDSVNTIKINLAGVEHVEKFR